jgi:hypothetical protein
MFEKHLFLILINRHQYKEEEKLEATQGGGMRIMNAMTGGGGTYYKNEKKKNLYIDKDFMGRVLKRFAKSKMENGSETE